MYTKKILPNGLTVLKVPIAGAKSVLVDVFVKTGSRHEEPRINGISHFLEHLFFKGSKRYPTALDLSHALDAIGAEYNANTGKEHTQFYIKAADKHLSFIFELLSDMLQRPIFAHPEIEREKGVVIEEINMYEDTPMRHVEDMLEEIMWPGHPLGRNIAGTREVIKSLTRENILDYVGTFYKPNNMILAVTGSYNERLLNGLIKKHWNEKIVPAAPPAPPWKKVRYGQRKPAYRIKPKKTEQYHFALGFRSYDHNHKYFIPQMVLATILGGGMSSRLFTEVRERRGLAYYIRAGATNYQDTGNFVIQAGVRLKAFREAMQTVMAELRKIKKHDLEKKELTKAKEYIKGTMTLSLEESESLLGWFLEQTAFRRQVLTPEKVFALVDKTTPADIKKVARDIFQKKNLNLAVIGPAKGGREIPKLLSV